MKKTLITLGVLSSIISFTFATDTSTGTVDNGTGDTTTIITNDTGSTAVTTTGTTSETVATTGNDSTTIVSTGSSTDTITTTNTGSTITNTGSQFKDQKQELLDKQRADREKIRENNKQIVENWTQFYKENGHINQFIRTDLTIEEKQAVKQLLAKIPQKLHELNNEARDIHKQYINGELTGSITDIQKTLLDKKVAIREELYNEFVKYVDSTKLESFKAYTTKLVEVMTRNITELKAENVELRKDIKERKDEIKKLISDKQKRALQKQFDKISKNNKSKFFNNVLNRIENVKAKTDTSELKAEIKEKKIALLIELKELIEAELAKLNTTSTTNQ